MEPMMRMERVIDLPRAIVWSALVDPVLVEGWLHPVLRLVGGAPAVELRERVDPVPGVESVLRVRSDELGELSLTLAELPGGTRGSSTAVVVEVQAPDPRFGVALRENWQLRLDQLENLLRGHPTVWSTTEAAPVRHARAN